MRRFSKSNPSLIYVSEKRQSNRDNASTAHVRVTDRGKDDTRNSADSKYVDVLNIIRISTDLFM